MALKDKEDFIEVLWVRTILYVATILLVLILFIVAPKKVFSSETPTTLAVSMAITDEDSLLIYDYKVYSTEERFNKGLVFDVKEVELEFQKRNEVVVVKIYGEDEKVEIRDNVIFITSPETPELNIEYYLAEYIKIGDTNIPCRTFILLCKDIIILVNNIYVALLIIVTMSILIPVSIKFTRNLVNLNIKRKSVINP